MSTALENEFTGFGRRTNGSCDSTETQCGPTNRGQYACCPDKMFCLGENNTVCCPDESEDCTDVLLETPRCAEPEWTMYNNSAPFCCSSDAVAAFKTDQDSNICADGGFQPLEGDFTLPVVEQDDNRTDIVNTDDPSGSAFPLTPVETGTLIPAGAPTAPVSDSEDSGTNVGAIAGGVVGGVLGLAIILFLFWFLRKRQKKNEGGQQQEEQQQPVQFSLQEKDGTSNPAAGRVEKDGTTRAPDASELENPEQVDSMGYYKPSTHQRPGERAELI
ncbi:hypothetical protein FQN54_005029 [Arachnomyces sp. PD_36]|nr:hypothetical protein FQN54_005029 [Arachnomyces sp. PD_36]